MSNVRTVSDTKRAFYTLHTRPINSIFRRVVEELMVEMHLLSVNSDFKYDSIFALGVVNSFDRFMQGYKPEGEKDSIFSALCKALEMDPERYRADAQRLRDAIEGLSEEELIAWLGQSRTVAGAEEIQHQFQAIAANPRFKYSRLFAIGLFTLIEHINPETAKDGEKLNTRLSQLAEALNISADKIQKDLELYRSNLEKMEQAKSVLEDILKAERKRREQQAQSEASSASPNNNSQTTTP